MTKLKCCLSRPFCYKKDLFTNILEVPFHCFLVLVLVVQICRLTKVKVFKLQDRFIHKHVKKLHFIRDCFFLLSWFWNCKSESLIVNFSFYPWTAFSICALKVHKNVVYHIFDGCISFNQNNESLLPGQVSQTTKWRLWNQVNIKKLDRGS